MKKLLLIIAALWISNSIYAQNPLDEKLPVRGFCIASPKPDGVERFVKFIDEELAPRHVNTLILRVDYNYQFKSHPELRDSIALSKKDVKKIVKVCRENGINLIPQINLLGHQSWANKVDNLLRVYPEFDETPWVKMPKNYKWPNEDGLYCKSYCPLHPEVHKVVFALIDEIMEVFEANAFHAGMDEVFYLGESKCPRCSGRDKAELFAGEVTRIRNHLAQNGYEMWIWGDRLIDGKTTGMGMWEASMNTTYRAIDLIPKDVFICDWHYERADPSPVMFAMKGYRVAICPWRKADVALKQLDMMLSLRENATPQMKDRFQGMIQTIWTSAENYMDLYYGVKEKPADAKGDQVKCFKDLFEAIGKTAGK